MLVWVAILGVLEVVVRAGVDTGMFVPSPSSVMVSIGEMLVSGSLPSNLGATMSRIAMGLAGGAGAGVLLGLAMGALFALPFALMPDPTTGQQYFWEILIPGSLVGLIVGFLTQRYGMPALAKR